MVFYMNNTYNLLFIFLQIYILFIVKKCNNNIIFTNFRILHFTLQRVVSENLKFGLKVSELCRFEFKFIYTLV